MHAVVSARCRVWSRSPLFGCVAHSHTHNDSEPMEVLTIALLTTPRSPSRRGSVADEHHRKSQVSSQLPSYRGTPLSNLAAPLDADG